MSVYRRCSQALRELIAEAEPFTEIDIIERASLNNWNEADFKKAMIQANQIAYAYYRSGRLARFGPIDHNGAPDYVRHSSKITYTGLDGPEKLATPNGTFKRLMFYSDEIASVGRRSGTDRDDFSRWKDKGEHGRLERKVRAFQRRFKERDKATTPA